MKKITILTILVYTTLMAGVTQKATWYDETWRKAPMASGYMYDKNRMEAAHRSLPFGTIVDVKNLGNGKVVRVIITDRGPYPNGLKAEHHNGKVIDLTPVAFEKIAKLKTGVIKIEMRVVKRGPCKTYNCYKKYPYRRGVRK